MVMRNFVIVVDVQADFMRHDGALPVPSAEALVEPINRWLHALRPDEVAGVLFTFDTHLAETYAASAEAKLFPPHCLHGSPGWESVLDLQAVDPAIPRYRLHKGVFDMWAEPGLTLEPLDPSDVAPTDRDRFFEQLRDRGVDQVTVIGVAADYCVRWAVEGLLARGFRVTVPTALTRGIERDAAVVAAEIGSERLALV
jgi:nicotinamidase/pyrazinamidase